MKNFEEIFKEKEFISLKKELLYGPTEEMESTLENVYFRGFSQGIEYKNNLAWKDLSTYPKPQEEVLCLTQERKLLAAFFIDSLVGWIGDDGIIKNVIAWLRIPSKVNVFIKIRKQNENI